jgi:hypothetical protein
LSFNMSCCKTSPSACSAKYACSFFTCYETVNACLLIVFGVGGSSLIGTWESLKEFRSSWSSVLLGELVQVCDCFWVAFFCRHLYKKFKSTQTCEMFSCDELFFQPSSSVSTPVTRSALKQHI